MVEEGMKFEKKIICLEYGESQGEDGDGLGVIVMTLVPSTTISQIHWRYEIWKNFHVQNMESPKERMVMVLEW